MCEHCGYEAQVSGGPDAGMVAVTETMTCHGCRELVDVVIGAYGKEGPTGNPDFDQDLNICAECGSADLTLWEASKPCPKCGRSMGEMDDGLTTLWD